MKKRIRILVFFPLLSIVFGAFACQTVQTVPPELPPEEPSENHQLVSHVIERPEYIERPQPPAPPALDVTLSHERFSLFSTPGDELLGINIQLTAEAPIRDWQIQILEPRYPHLVFHEWSGSGEPPQYVLWNGRNNLGEFALSVSVYPLRVTVTDENENYAVFERDINVDIIVIREPNSMRILVPSLTFAPNSASMTAGLSPGVIAHNEYVLQIVAAALNRLGNYRVRIDGHNDFSYGVAANVQRPPQQLLPLSRQRAGTVFNSLVRLGVTQTRLSTMGMSSTHPLANFDDIDNRWKNDRVEFVLLRW